MLYMQGYRPTDVWKGHQGRRNSTLRRVPVDAFSYGISVKGAYI